MKIGDYITTTIYGHNVRVLILAINAAGTIDVQRADGKCFMLSIPRIGFGYQFNQ